MTLRELISAILAEMGGGVWDGGSPAQSDRETFIVDPAGMRDLRLQAYRTWYTGQVSELWNFYHRGMLMDFHWEPWYLAPVRQYFWATITAEQGAKATHSGQPQNLIDTTAALVGYPEVTVVGSKGNMSAEVNSWMAPFWESAYPESLKMCMVEGWGCYKLAFDKSVSDHPYCSYCQAPDVEFAFRGGRLMGVVFKDWITSGDRTFLKLEARWLRSTPKGRDMVSKVSVFEQIPQEGGDAMLMRSHNLPDSLAKLEQTTVFEGADDLYAYPVIIRSDPADKRMYGASFFENKTSLFDDLDQMLSIESGCVAASVPEILFNSDFLERDPDTGLYKAPRKYSRKFMMYHGGKTVDGTPNSAAPVQVAQPQINIQQYAQGEIEIMSHICSGWLSLATLGIQVATQSTAQAQKEKERVTKSTRDWIVRRFRGIISSLVRGWISLDSRIYKRPAEYYEVSVEYPDFASTSFEDRIAVCGEQLANGNMSPETFMRKVYMRELPADAYAKELDYLKAMHQTPEEQMESQQAMMGGDDGQEAAELGDQSKQSGR